MRVFDSVPGPQPREQVSVTCVAGSCAAQAHLCPLVAACFGSHGLYPARHVRTVQTYRPVPRSVFASDAQARELVKTGGRGTKKGTGKAKKTKK